MPRKEKKNYRPIEFRDSQVKINQQKLVFKGVTFVVLMMFISYLLNLLFTFKDTHGDKIFEVISHIISLFTGGVIGNFIGKSNKDY